MHVVHTVLSIIYEITRCDCRHRCISTYLDISIHTHLTVFLSGDIVIIGVQGQNEGDAHRKADEIRAHLRALQSLFQPVMDRPKGCTTKRLKGYRWLNLELTIAPL